MSILQSLPFSLCEPGPEQVEGTGNFSLQILARAPRSRRYRLSISWIHTAKYRARRRIPTMTPSSRAKSSGSQTRATRSGGRVRKAMAMATTMALVGAAFTCLWPSSTSPSRSSATTTSGSTAAVDGSRPRAPASIRISTTHWQAEAYRHWAAATTT